MKGGEEREKTGKRRVRTFKGEREQERVKMEEKKRLGIFLEQEGEGKKRSCLL